METPEGLPRPEQAPDPARRFRFLRALPWKPILIVVVLGLALLALGLVCSPAYWR